MEQLRVGIAGLNRGRAFMEALEWHPRTRIAAICDPDPERLEHCRERLGDARPFRDYSEMLDSGVDLVIVASPVQFHGPQSIEALKRNIHVFSEVIAATSLEECRDLAAAARQSSAKYMMGENCCFMKSHMVVRNMARAGVFGELYYAEGAYVHYVRTLRSVAGWREEWLFGRRGGTYLTHALGPILEWLDDVVVTVNCVGTGSHAEPRFGGDDSSTLLCKTAKGAMVVLRNDMSSPRPFRGYASLQGTKGAYEPDWGHDGKLGERVCLPDPESRDSHPAWRPLSEFEDEFLPEIWRNRPEGMASHVHGDADGLTVLAFVEAVLNDEEPPINVHRALDFTVPGLVSAVSAEQGGTPVAVPTFR